MGKKGTKNKITAHIKLRLHVRLCAVAREHKIKVTQTRAQMHTHADSKCGKLVNQ